MPVLTTPVPPTTSAFTTMLKLQCAYPAPQKGIGKRQILQIQLWKCGTDVTA